MSPVKTSAFQHVSFEGTRVSPSGQRASASPAGAQAEPDPTCTPSPAHATGLPFQALALAGLDPAAYRLRPLTRRVPACLRALNVATEVEALKLLAASPSAAPRALSALLIGVTAFFRDDTVFTTIAEKVLPDLAATGRPLRVWSAGCSSGAELYSVAILLAEAGLLERAELLGSDCQPQALARAEAGIFDENCMLAVPPDLRARYFDPVGGGRWRVSAVLRGRATWKAANILQGIEPGPWDLILWRNVAIYLDTGPVSRIQAGLVRALAEEGYLVLGKAERAPAGCGLVPIARCIRRMGRRGHEP
jgi:chemotaxis protein methyltransferase CheR